MLVSFHIRGTVSDQIQRLPDQSFKAFRKPFVVLFRAFGGPFQVMLAAAPGLFRQMAIHEQPFDVFIREPFAALVDGPRSLAQRRSGFQ